MNQFGNDKRGYLYILYLIDLKHFIRLCVWTFRTFRANHAGVKQSKCDCRTYRTQWR